MTVGFVPVPTRQRARTLPLRDIGASERFDRAATQRRPAFAGLLLVSGQSDDLDEDWCLRLVREHLPGHDLGRIRDELLELLLLRPLGGDASRVLGLAGRIEQAGDPTTPSPASIR
jgi:hypothetical protein